MSDPDRDIPAESRLLVEQRQNLRCMRCGGKGADMHHRRSRRVRADHRHDPCNLVLLDRSCHRWAHANPDEARVTGFVVSQWVDEPFLVPVMNPWGWWQLQCNGGYAPLTMDQIATDGMGGFVVVLAGLTGGFPVE